MGDEECEKYYPVEVHSVDYISAGKTARDLRTRTITKKMRLCNMVLDAHARLKLIQLAGSERYDRKTDLLTIRSERCPTQKQNKDFIDYVITALYFESWKREAWETRGNMSESDGYYWWEDSQSERSVERVLKAQFTELENYRQAVIDVKLEPEIDELGRMNEKREEIVENYKNSVLQLLNVKPLQKASATS